HRAEPTARAGASSMCRSGARTGGPRSSTCHTRCSTSTGVSSGSGCPTGGASSRRAVDNRFRLWWALVFVLGVAMRLGLWSGFGLGDDPNYFSAYHGIYLSGVIEPHTAYDFRFAFSIPVVLSMNLLGPTEVGFTAFVTLCSLANLGLVYLLARQEWERPHALLAMTLLAVFPL